MTTQQENEAIAAWAGLECRCSTMPGYVGRPPYYAMDCPRHSNGGLPPDYDRDEVAVNLLEVIKHKGIEVCIETERKSAGWKCFWCKPVDPRFTPVWDFVFGHTIAAAIKAAVMQLIEKEKP